MEESSMTSQYPYFLVSVPTPPKKSPKANARSLAKMLKKKGADGVTARTDVDNEVWIIKR